MNSRKFKNPCDQEAFVGSTTYIDGKRIDLVIPHEGDIIYSLTHQHPSEVVSPSIVRFNPAVGPMSKDHQ